MEFSIFPLMHLTLRAYHVPMTLVEYRDRETLTLSALADRLGMRVSTVHGYLSGARRPEPKQCVAIARATNGAVTPRELRPDLAEIFA